MSRTTRRKNYEIESEQNSWRRWGKKTGLEYTTYQDNGRYETGEFPDSYSGGTYPVTARYLETPVEMEKRERYYKWRTMHGESRNANQYTPGKWYRKNRMSQNRSINKQELHRWFQYGGEYDPCFEADPRSHYWDWS
jgi:hypothetical protein